MASGRGRWLLSFRIASLVFALGLAFSGKYPPARAQKTTCSSPECISQRLDGIDDHLKEDDGKIQRQWERTTATDTAQTHLEGVMEGFGTLLTLMVGGSITLQVRKPK